MTTRHSTLFTLGAGKSDLSFYTTQRDAADPEDLTPFCKQLNNLMGLHI